MVRKFWRVANVWSVILPALVVAAIAFLGLTAGSYVQYVLSLSLVAMMCAVALVLLVGLARIITLASGAMMGLGAYTLTLLMIHFDVPYLLGIAIAALIGGVAGLVLGISATRFRGHHLAMVTLVFQFIVIIVIRQWSSLTEGAQGIRVPSASIWNTALKTDTQFLVFTAGSAILVVTIAAVLVRGNFGKTLRAISATEIGAEAFGIDIAGFRIMAFVISSAMIAFAGAVQAPQVRILDPEGYGVIRSVLLLAYPIVGGMTSVWGGILGGGILRSLPETLRAVAEYQELVYAGLVLAVIVFSPGGIVEIIERLGRLVRRTQSRPLRERDSKASVPGHAFATPTGGQVDHAATPKFEPTAPSEGMDQGGPALAVTQVFKSFGALVAVDNVHLTISAGTIHGLIGPNGAGKTTLFNMVSGFLTPDEGTIRVFDVPMDDKSARERIAHGVTRTFQHVAIYGPLSCLDNVVLGLGENGVIGSLWKSFDDFISGPASRERREKALQALAAVGLEKLAFEPASALSLGNQRRLEIARAIVSRPRLLMFDEPVSGLEADEHKRLGELLLDINARLGVTMLIIEHNVRFVADLSHTLSVMNLGKIIAEGEPREVIELPEVERVYFGT